MQGYGSHFARWVPDAEFSEAPHAKRSTCQDADDLAETRRKARRINHYLDRPGILTGLDSARSLLAALQDAYCCNHLGSCSHCVSGSRSLKNNQKSEALNLNPRLTQLIHEAAQKN